MEFTAEKAAIEALLRWNSCDHVTLENKLRNEIMSVCEELKAFRKNPERVNNLFRVWREVLKATKAAKREGMRQAAKAATEEKRQAKIAALSDAEREIYYQNRAATEARTQRRRNAKSLSLGITERQKQAKADFIMKNIHIWDVETCEIEIPFTDEEQKTLERTACILGMDKDFFVSDIAAALSVGEIDKDKLLKLYKVLYAVKKHHKKTSASQRKSIGDWVELLDDRKLKDLQKFLSPLSKKCS